MTACDRSVSISPLKERPKQPEAERSSAHPEEPVPGGESDSVHSLFQGVLEGPACVLGLLPRFLTGIVCSAQERVSALGGRRDLGLGCSRPASDEPDPLVWGSVSAGSFLVRGTRPHLVLSLASGIPVTCYSHT